MNEKKSFKQEVKEWWQENKKVVKTGIICGLAGAAYGFIKGTLTVSKMLINGSMTVERPEEPDWDSDKTLTEENCDDPELLELVRLGSENRAFSFLFEGTEDRSEVYGEPYSRLLHLLL